MPDTSTDRQALWVSIAALGVSAVAVAFSACGVYYQFLREHHELYATVLDLSVPNASFTFQEGILQADVLLENRGNRSEALIAAEFGYAIAPSERYEFSFGTTTRGPGDLSAPVVLSPGESKLVTLREKISTKLLSQHLDTTPKTVRVFIKFDHSRSPVLGHDSIVRCGSFEASVESMQLPSWSRVSIGLVGPGA